MLFRRVCKILLVDTPANKLSFPVKQSKMSISTSNELKFKDFRLLSDGNRMPAFGLGCYKLTEDEATSAVRCAISRGYRMFDTAAYYGNERQVGIALRESNLHRSEYFVVTKLWHSNHGYEATVDAIGKSLSDLGLSYIDLYLIHGPAAGKNIESWSAMIEMKSKGFIKSIGVSNFNIHHIQPIKDAGLELPVVNQIELHPWLQQKEVVEFCRRNGIFMMGYCPLARCSFFEPGQYEIMDVTSLKYCKTKAQILLRWALQKGFITIPKSSQNERINENADIFDFQLDEIEMRALDALDCNGRVSTASINSPWID